MSAFFHFWRQANFVDFYAKPPGFQQKWAVTFTEFPYQLCVIY